MLTLSERWLVTHISAEDFFSSTTATATARKQIQATETCAYMIRISSPWLTSGGLTTSAR